MASIFKHKRTTLERAEKFISTSEWTDCNLVSQLYPHRLPITDLTYFSPVFSPVALHPTFKTLTFDAAVKENFKPTAVGNSFGPTWSTHWFRLGLTLPSEWCGQEVHVRWDCSCEAQVWSEDGEPLQGLSSEVDRTDVIVSKSLCDSELTCTLYIEIACNSMFGASTCGLIGPPNNDQNFTLKTAEIAVFDRQIFYLIQDMKCIVDIAKYLPEDNQRSFQALYTANHMVNLLQVDRSNVGEARGVAEKFLSQHNGDSQHTIVAIGNCHIDCAWLWPYGETVRKCARSWSSTIKLCEEYPQYKFACSQAQQLYWMKAHYPLLWEKIQKFAGEGRFLLVGGTWVEMDGHMPSGEAFIRQFLYGQHFFLKNFGNRCTEFWLPDTFGYSAQLPQIARHCGINRFLTQKLSWSLVNSFPHHNFLWEGIDGSELLTHFPPGDSYAMKMEVSELLTTVKNLKDKGRVNKSILLYGYGDGGGGPTDEMIERALRLHNVDGIPQVDLSTPDDFFTHLEANSSNLCRWVGELYLELHNGTYTSQAAIKKFNRQTEMNFRDLELLSSVLYSISRKVSDYPQDDFESLWHVLLLNQFHDVLPGTCINSAVTEVLQMYDTLKMKQRNHMKATMERLFGAGGEISDLVLVNTLSWPRTEVVKTGEGSRVVVSVPPMGVSKLNTIEYIPVQSVTKRNVFILKNEYIKAIVNDCGQVTSLKLRSGEELIPPGGLGNQFVLFEDVPLFWDAWDVMDYHLETRQPQNKMMKHMKIVHSDEIQVILEGILSIGAKSEAVLRIIVNCCKPYVMFDVAVNWKEDHKFLKVEFPANVLSREATYEIQFGHLKRPTHRNTSWDSARFEVCGHKWADIAEHDLGLAVLNDCKYGYSAFGNTLTLSLLRSSKQPDPVADMGTHKFQYALMPHRGSFQSAEVIERAYEFNCPLLIHRLAVQASMLEVTEGVSWFEVNEPGVIIETIKKAEVGSTALIARIYEAYGRRVQVRFSSSLPIYEATKCSGLEDPTEELDWTGGGVLLDLTPFQICSIILYLT